MSNFTNSITVTSHKNLNSVVIKTIPPSSSIYIYDQQHIHIYIYIYKIKNNVRKKYLLTEDSNTPKYFNDAFSFEYPIYIYIYIYIYICNV